MKYVIAFIAVCITLVAAAPLLNIESETIIPDQYLIAFHKNSSVAIRDLHVAELRLSSFEKILNVFDIGTLIGYSAILSKETLARVLENPLIRHVEADQKVSIVADSTNTQTGATWGLDRIDQKALPLSTSYAYFASAGEGVKAYVIDTGIHLTHNDFGGRAKHGINTVTGEANTDLNGHGTHVASTIGGQVYGVAKKVTLIAVKVLNQSGSGSWAGVIAGVDYVTKQHKKDEDFSVANMSLGGGATPTLDEAVKNSIIEGIVYAIAAGNNNANACNYSPAGVPEAITVGATTSTDARSSFSNYGTCVDIFAPGSAITAAWYTSNTATNSISGTSMASPHVAGVVASHFGHLLADGSAAKPTPKQIETWIRSVSTKGVITSVGAGSPNDLLFCPHQES